MSPTTIEWTNETWNPVRGCSKVSEGCRNCYAMSVAARFSGPGQPYEGLATRSPARWTGKVQFIEDRLRDPLSWQRPRLVFVNSMSDLFHEDIPDGWIDRVFGVMAAASRHTFQVLTKRPERMRDYMIGRDWGDSLNAVTDLYVRRLSGPLHLNGEIFPPLPNVWLGTSIETQVVAGERIRALLATPAAIRFLSCEPLIGPLDLGFAARYVGWVIAGGESGPRARPCDEAWLRSLRDQCVAAGVPYFLKQKGGWPDKRGHEKALLDGERWTQMPQRVAR